MMQKIKKYLPLLAILSILSFYTYLFIKNKGIDSLTDDWELTILGALTALLMSAFVFRKALAAFFRKK